jgi:hypothetical protein
MPHLEPVHVLELDRATAKMECVRINQTRSFGKKSAEGFVWFTWQNGYWFGPGGGQIPEELVPQECRDAIASNPVTVLERGPAVVVVCEFCGERMNRSDKEQHLIEHVRKTLASAGTPQLPSTPDAHPEERPRARAAS